LALLNEQGGIDIPDRVPGSATFSSPHAEFELAGSGAQDRSWEVLADVPSAAAPSSASQTAW